MSEPCPVLPSLPQPSPPLQVCLLLIQKTNCLSRKENFGFGAFYLKRSWSQISDKREPQSSLRGESALSAVRQRIKRRGVRNSLKGMSPSQAQERAPALRSWYQVANTCKADAAGAGSSDSQSGPKSKAGSGLRQRPVCGGEGQGGGTRAP